jgi:hypothetical protein
MSKSENRALSAEVHIRLSPELARVLRVDAENLNLSDASMVRHVLARHYRDIDLDDITNTKRYRKQNPNPSPEMVKVAQLREVVAELGGTLRQIAGLSRKDGQHANHAEIETFLPRIKQTLDFLDGLKEVV